MDTLISYAGCPCFQPFTCLATRDAINAAKSSFAVGPDGVMAIHLKDIGPRAIAYLTALFNFLVNKANLSTIWKATIIVPIQKPGKPADLGPSYRPISLLSPGSPSPSHRHCCSS
jgi:hypothetical protein